MADEQYRELEKREEALREEIELLRRLREKRKNV